MPTTDIEVKRRKLVQKEKNNNNKKRVIVAICVSTSLKSHYIIITIITTYYHYHYHDALNLPSVLSSPITQFLSTGLSPCALKNKVHSWKEKDSWMGVPQ